MVTYSEGIVMSTRMPTQDCNGLYYIVKPISVYARTSTQGEVQYLIMHALFILYPNYIYMNILHPFFSSKTCNPILIKSCTVRYFLLLLIIYYYIQI